MAPKVSVIISNRNDLAMLSVTVRSCIEELRPLGQGNGEIVICDNSDKEIYPQLRSVLPTGYCRDGVLKILRQDFPCLFSARETAAEAASGDYIVCLDSHMLVGHNCLLDLFQFMERKVDDPTVGFAHAPISWAHQHEKRSKQDRDMSVHELGDWGSAYQDERPITWKGMPWICRRKWFLDRDKGLNAYGALAKHHISWGGGDMHIGIKPWLLGFKNWAVPTTPGIHIGPFPRIDLVGHSAKVATGPRPERYRLYSNSGEYPHTFGFLVSCYILGGEPMMHRNKTALNNRFGMYLDTDKMWSKAIELGQEERDWLLKRQVMSFDDLLTVKPWLNGHSSSKN